MAAPQTLEDRDAALTVTTSGEFEVELFKGYAMRDGELKWAHHFREYTENASVVTSWIRAWLDAEVASTP